MKWILLIIILLIGSILAIGRANAFTKELHSSKITKIEYIFIFIGNWISFLGGLVVYFERNEKILLDFKFKKKR